MAIKFTCKQCGKEIQFPETPDFETNRNDQIAHMIYSDWATVGLCVDCKKRLNWIIIEYLNTYINEYMYCNINTFIK